MKLNFFGGAQSVTGANYLLEATDKNGKEVRIIVDCGLVQGDSKEEEKNYEKFQYDTKTVDAVFITHAHIDHTGRLPFLYRSGFRNKIYSTKPTKDLTEQLLVDSQGLLEKDAIKKGIKPLYTAEDVEGVMRLFEGVDYHQKIEIDPFTFEYFDAGHILGSGFIKVTGPAKDGGMKTIVFSGDLGNKASPLVRDTEKLEGANVIVMEALYGDKFHEEPEKRMERLEDAIEDSVHDGGVLMIPAFSMERTQELLYEIDQLIVNRRIPRVPIFVDSPLAIKLISVYKKYSDDPLYFDEAAMKMFESGEQVFNFPGLTLTLTTNESKEINDVPPPKVIIAGSGMSEGGRMIHHEYRYLSDPKSTLLFISYQASHSLGRRILNGERMVKIFGEDILVRCKIKSIGGYSAHADQAKLLEWLSPIRETVEKVYLVQSEIESAQVFAVKARDVLAIDTEIPEGNESIEI